MLAFGSGMGPQPDEVKILAPASSVIMFNSASLWHSGTFNYSPAPRLAVTAGFSPGCGRLCRRAGGSACQVAGASDDEPDQLLLKGDVFKAMDRTVENGPYQASRTTVPQSPEGA